MVNCDENEFQIWKQSTALRMLDSPPTRPVNGEMSLKATAINLRPAWSKTLEFSVRTGRHFSMDASSGGIVISEY